MANKTPPTLDEELKVLMEQYPNLTYSGLECKDPNSEFFKQDVVRLLLAGDQIRRARRWIQQNCRHRKLFNKSRTSYGLKHDMEHDISHTYIANGACIAAFLLEGYRMNRISPRSLNCFFNISFVRPGGRSSKTSG